MLVGVFRYSHRYSHLRDSGCAMNSGRFRTPTPALHRASTVLFDDIAHLTRVQREMVDGGDASLYSTFGTPTTAALAEALLAREGGAAVSFAPSGLGAVSLALMAVLRQGDHLLMVDSSYGPTRAVCDGVLRRFGVETEYYDPLIGGEIAARIRQNTRAVFMESPGSFTFEVQDVPAIVAAVSDAERERGTPIYTLIDNAWGSPGLFTPLPLGVDISIVPLTKYWGGHADLLLGAVIANDRSWKLVRGAAFDLGICTNGDDASLALRGSRTADVRLRQHAESSLVVARWLEGHPRVGQVLHPALPGSPGHELWKRDFRGSNGLLAFELLEPSGAPSTPTDAAAVADALAHDGLFGLGYSWGGFESLVMPGVLPNGTTHQPRRVRGWSGGALLRLHIGLEPVEALVRSLEGALRPTATT